eukprot:gene40615-53718_t
MQAIAANRQEDSDPVTEIEREIDCLIAEHGSERAAIRALLPDMTMLLADADRSTSRGYLRGFFSHGARNMAIDDEP